MDHHIHPWQAVAVAVVTTVGALALLFAFVGCATVTWACPEPVKLDLRDTSTEVRCESTGKTVTITHPKGTRQAVAP
ncbi:hypothetical protein EBT16_01540 [bacterium]|nr:hypothetical protein [bacterium]